MRRPYTCILGLTGLHLASLIMISPALATNLPPVWDLKTRLTTEQWSWRVPQETDLPGVRLRSQMFHSTLALDEAARQMAAFPGGPFDRLVIINGAVLLSGLEGDRHWLAELRGGPGGVSGNVSSLALNRAPDPFDSASFAPPGAQRVFMAETRSGSFTALIGYRWVGSPKAAAAFVAQALNDADWRTSCQNAQAALSEGLICDWQRKDGSAVSVQLNKRSDATILTFWFKNVGA